MKNLLSHRILACIMAAQLLVACSSDGDEVVMPATTAETGLTVELPISIDIESAWNIDDDGVTRAAPPGGPGNGGNGGTATTSDGWVNAEDDIEGVDQVRIVTFRRKDTETGGGADSIPFLYDKLNDRIVSIVGWKDVDKHDCEPTYNHRHRYAEGSITATYGYEYRVIALAYNSQRTVPYAANGSYDNMLKQGEHNWMDTNEHDGLTLEEFEATIKTQLCKDLQNPNGWREYFRGADNGATTDNLGHLSYYIMAYPQLFWGYCHTGDKQPIIRLPEMGTSISLTGLLYRGMAKVTVEIDNVGKYKNDEIGWLCLMGDNLKTRVGLSSYDDFLKPDNPVPARDKKGIGIYTSFGYQHINDNTGRDTITAWVLPTRTRLALRGMYHGTRSYSAANWSLHAYNLTYGDTGTGIISPDVIDKYFYLRRNHSYVLKVTSIGSLNSSELN